MIAGEDLSLSVAVNASSTVIVAMG
jgi:hypothetical protein